MAFFSPSNLWRAAKDTGIPLANYYIKQQFPSRVADMYDEHLLYQFRNTIAKQKEEIDLLKARVADLKTKLEDNGLPVPTESPALAAADKAVTAAAAASASGSTPSSSPAFSPYLSSISPYGLPGSPYGMSGLNPYLIGHPRATHHRRPRSKSPAGRATAHRTRKSRR